ncbi:hypothetical protein [Plantactinospora sp. KBS50]|uniref:hypothetical protein n=1 Tax=Plantactinospora sp. KBS50 TaxID=2024580 RepID=UPI000BAB0EFF|nr:hypothetical protein [Plantactinospora sp. KBS50]ASW56404.1 hypothetical protein CIK06_22950 [Plantactinospora sp. KBS50]
MAKKFLGKVVAGAALGGAALLLGAPGIALADAAPTHDPDAHDKSGTVWVNPRVVRPGETVDIGEVCTEAQASPRAWSKLTGQLTLHEVPYDPERAAEHARLGAQYAGTGDSDEAGPDAGPPVTASPAASPSASASGGTGGGVLADDGHGKGPRPPMEDGAAQEMSSDADPHVYVVEHELSEDARPGHYTVYAACGEAELIVSPDGPVNGGDGGAAVNKGLATGGAGALAAAAITGVALLRRRRTHGSIA